MESQFANIAMITFMVYLYLQQKSKDWVERQLIAHDHQRVEQEIFNQMQAISMTNNNIDLYYIEIIHDVDMHWVINENDPESQSDDDSEFDIDLVHLAPELGSLYLSDDESVFDDLSLEVNHDFDDDLPFDFVEDDLMWNPDFEPQSEPECLWEDDDEQNSGQSNQEHSSIVQELLRQHFQQHYQDDI